MNDTEIVGIFDQWKELISSYFKKNNLRKYIDFDDFKNEVFIRFYKWHNVKYFNLENDKSSIFNYLKLICSQVASEQFKKGAFIFSRHSARNTDVQALCEAQKQYINSLFHKQYGTTPSDNEVASIGKHSTFNKKILDFNTYRKLPSRSHVKDIELHDFIDEKFKGLNHKIVKMLLDGYKRKEIAEKLDVSYNQVYIKIKKEIAPVISGRI